MCSDQYDSDSSEVKSVSSRPDFVQIEKNVLAFWEKNDSFGKLRKCGCKDKLFNFLDGPITANNPMGVHHAWGRGLKDIFLRYKSLNGYTSFYQNGFDCQGLWVEVEVEKDLGFKCKADIEAFGLDKFSEACKARIKKFSGIQTEQSRRLGQWMQWDNSYYTHTDTNIQGIWHFLHKCSENGWLYKSGIPMPWCIRCGTSLSEHEMSGSYKQMSHLAVYFKLLVPALNARILVWTTTPWTLAANTGLAVNPRLEYLKVKLPSEELPLIIGADAISSWKGQKYEVLETMKGSALVGLEYEPVIPDLPVQHDFPHKIVPWEDVDATEGTGVVHTAPGCGREDFELSKQVELKVLCPVDERGDYTAGTGWLEGKNVMNVGQEVADYLEKNGKLFKRYMHEHSYPVCWRCKHELVFRLVEEWYISCDEIRPKMIEAAAEVKWQPDYVGKRMENWLQNMGDWCISRKRFWGLPLPFYPCKSCGTMTIVKSREDLAKLSGDDLKSLPELHRPWIDAIQINCPKCRAKVSRVTEVGDCWLDAGIVPFSTRGYFESEEARRNWQRIDWICEMSEQVRLWFYSVLFMGVTLTGKSPYSRVLTHESVRAEDGSRFSKTGFMIRFDDAVEKMGADTMRYYFAAESPLNDIRFGYTRGDEARRQVLSLWNIFTFFSTYAGIDRPEISSIKGIPALTEMDRWLLARTYDFVSKAEAAYEDFNTPAVVREYESFVENVSNWYIRANRRRFWKSGSTDDKLAGYWSLYQALKSCLLVMSPIMPFLTEHMWQETVRSFEKDAPESIHHASWLKADASWADEARLKKATDAQLVINCAHRLRADAQIKVRQPLARLFVSAGEAMISSIREQENLILNELNVKELVYLASKEELFENYLELDLRKAGPVLKGSLGTVTATVNGLAGEGLKKALTALAAGQDVPLPDQSDPVTASIFIVKQRPRPGLKFSEEQGLFAALDTEVTKALREEGWIRDILRQCQVQRKDSGFEVQDRISLSIKAENAELSQAVQQYKALIESETLGSLSPDVISGAASSTELELSCGKVQISMKKAL